MPPACCICDPEACAADDTGEHCAEQSCGACLHGCPAPDGQCCTAPTTTREDGTR
ncbi:MULTISPECIES: hypothetical protein [unclassified Micromonospora]|uniref:hypothetical protein n=1 Tax=unclassified Micromonospora TaxID=2617518 RepID=UPI001304134C|nr:MULTISPECIES: hypothetical protein [unclassified Micromonospora]MDI5936965.1 hypothetical protein [Micromonospora sp. DH15]